MDFKEYDEDDLDKRKRSDAITFYGLMENDT